MPLEDILQLENELKTLKNRLENFKKQSLSASDDTPNVLDTAEQARVQEFEKTLRTLEQKISQMKAKFGPGYGGVEHEDVWKNDY